jgi:hypothetical protein
MIANGLFIANIKALNIAHLLNHTVKTLNEPMLGMNLL